MRFPAASGEKAKFQVAPKKRKGSELSVFKGREARLNRAIFEILATFSPQTKRELQKKVSKRRDLRGTYYASISKRMNCLETAGYVKEVKRERIKVESRASDYELRPKAHLAMTLDSIPAENLLDVATDNSASILLLAIVNAIMSDG